MLPVRVPCSLVSFCNNRLTAHCAERASFAKFSDELTHKYVSETDFLAIENEIRNSPRMFSFQESFSCL